MLDSLQGVVIWKWNQDEILVKIFRFLHWCTLTSQFWNSSSRCVHSTIQYKNRTGHRKRTIRQRHTEKFRKTDKQRKKVNERIPERGRQKVEEREREEMDNVLHLVSVWLLTCHHSQVSSTLASNSEGCGWNASTTTTCICIAPSMLGKASQSTSEMWQIKCNNHK